MEQGTPRLDQRMEMEVNLEVEPKMESSRLSRVSIVLEAFSVSPRWFTWCGSPFSMEIFAPHQSPTARKTKEMGKMRSRIG